MPGFIVIVIRPHRSTIRCGLLIQTE